MKQIPKGPLKKKIATHTGVPGTASTKTPIWPLGDERRMKAEHQRGMHEEAPLQKSKNRGAECQPAPANEASRTDRKSPHDGGGVYRTGTRNKRTKMFGTGTQVENWEPPVGFNQKRNMQARTEKGSVTRGKRERSNEAESENSAKRAGVTSEIERSRR